MAWVPVARRGQVIRTNPTEASGHTPMRTNTTSVTGETKLRQESLGPEPRWRRSREVTKAHKIQTFIEVYATDIILRIQIWYRTWRPSGQRLPIPSLPSISCLTARVPIAHSTRSARRRFFVLRPTCVSRLRKGARAGDCCAPRPPLGLIHFDRRAPHPRWRERAIGPRRPRCRRGGR